MLTVPLKILVVWVLFLYTDVSSLPSLSGLIKMSRKGSDPSGPGSSVVNWILLSTELMWVRNSSLWAFFKMTKVSSTNLWCASILQGRDYDQEPPVNPTDKDPMMKKSGVIYSYKCDRVECDEEYIGESSRTFGERFEEHQKTPSPIFDHFNITGHSISVDNFNIVGRENQNLKEQ